MKYCWHLMNLDFNLIGKLKRHCKQNWKDVKFKIDDIPESSHKYRKSAGKKNLALETDNFCTESREKRNTYTSLNETEKSRKCS